MALTKVSSSLVSDNAITTGKLVDGGVHSADIADVAVTSAKIANNAILTQHIDDAQVTTDQLGADAVTAAKIADNAVSEEHLDITVITSLTAVTAATGDLLMVADVSDSNNLKKIPVSSILAGTHTGAVNTSGTISSGAITSTGMTVNSRTTYGSGGFFDNASNGNNIGIKTGGNHIFLTDGNGGVADGTKDIGIATRRVRDIYMSGTLTTGTINSGAITASADISVVESNNAKLIVNSVGDYFPSLEIKRTSASSKTNYAWNFQIGSSGFLNLIDGTNSYYAAIFKNNGDIALSNDTDSTNPVLLLDKSASSATFAGTISSGAITSGSHLINASSSAFGGSSVQGFNSDFLVDTGQGYSRHNSYHTGGSNHQFLVNATGSTTNTVALAINKDANATFAGTISSGAITATASNSYFRHADNAGIQIQTTAQGLGGSDGVRIGLNGSHGFIWNYEAKPLAFATSGTERLSIGATGPFDFKTNNLTNIGTISSGAITAGTVAPSANNVYSLGSTSNYYTQGYITNVNTTNITAQGAITAGTIASDTIEINTNANSNTHGLNITNSALSGAGSLKITIPGSNGSYASSATLNDIVIRNETTGGSIIIGAPDSVQIGVGGTDSDTRLTVDSSGNVGIGVTSIPGWANLITNGTVAVGGTLYMKTGNPIQALSDFPGGASDLKMQTGGGKVTIGGSGGGDRGHLELFGRYGSGDPKLSFRSDHPTSGNTTTWDMARISASDGGNYNGVLSFQVAAGSGSEGSGAALSTAMTIQDTGYVGIGELVPVVPLHVRKVAGLNTTVELLRLDCGDTTHVGGKAGTIKFTDISVYNPTAEITAARVGVTSSSFLKFDLRSSEIMRMESGGDMIYGGATGVHEKYFSGFTTGNGSFSHDIIHTADSGVGTNLKIMAAFTHHPSYDCMLESWVSRRDAGFVQYEQFRRNTTTSGSWALSRVSSTVTRVTKVAGTYAGGGPYWIKAVWRNY